MDPGLLIPIFKRAVIIDIICNIDIARTSDGQGLCQLNL